jgi:hypothetical protein
LAHPDCRGYYPFDNNQELRRGFLEQLKHRLNPSAKIYIIGNLLGGEQFFTSQRWGLAGYKLTIKKELPYPSQNRALEAHPITSGAMRQAALSYQQKGFSKIAGEFSRLAAELNNFELQLILNADARAPPVIISGNIDSRFVVAWRDVTGKIHWNIPPETLPQHLREQIEIHESQPTEWLGIQAQAESLAMQLALVPQTLSSKHSIMSSRVSPKELAMVITLLRRYAWQAPLMPDNILQLIELAKYFVPFFKWRASYSNLEASGELEGYVRLLLNGNINDFRVMLERNYLIDLIRKQNGHNIAGGTCCIYAGKFTAHLRNLIEEKDALGDKTLVLTEIGPGNQDPQEINSLLRELPKLIAEPREWTIVIRVFDLNLENLKLLEARLLEQGSTFYILTKPFKQVSLECSFADVLGIDQADYIFREPSYKEPSDIILFRRISTAGYTRTYQEYFIRAIVESLPPKGFFILNDYSQDIVCNKREGQAALGNFYSFVSQVMSSHEQDSLPSASSNMLYWRIIPIGHPALSENFGRKLESLLKTSAIACRYVTLSQDLSSVPTINEVFANLERSAETAFGRQYANLMILIYTAGDIFSKKINDRSGIEQYVNKINVMLQSIYDYNPLI